MLAVKNSSKILKEDAAYRTVLPHPHDRQKPTFVVMAVVGGELRAPEPGEPGDPGEPGFSGPEEGGLDRLVLVEPEKDSLKLGLCLPDRLDLPSTSLSSVSFTCERRGGRGEENVILHKEMHRYNGLQFPRSPSKL